MMVQNNGKNKSGLWLLVAEFAVLASLPFLVPQAGILIVAAFVPLFFLDKYLSEREYRHPFLYYYVAFLLFNTLTTWWVWNATAAGSIAAIALNALQMAAVFAIYRWAKKEFSKRSKRTWEAELCSFLFLIITWTAWEHIYYETEVAWPWLALGNALATSPQLAQWYEVFGTQGGTVWILLCNVAIFMALNAKTAKLRKVTAAAAAAIIVIPCVCSLIRYFSYEENIEDTVNIVVAQPNVDPYEKFGVTPQDQLDTHLMELFLEEMTPETDFIITPETFTFNVNIDNPTNHISIARYQDFLSGFPNTRMILGAMAYRNYTATLKPTYSARRGAGDRNWYDTFNAVMVLDKSNVYGHYFKSKLVPGAERVPYAKYLSFLGPLFANLGGGASSYGTQDDMEPIDCGNGHKVAGIICYESVFGDYCSRAAKKGADFLTIITNDGWWGNTPGHLQHLRYAKLRAIECRKDVIFAANTGVSAVIDQKGDYLIETPYWEETIFETKLSTNKKVTPFAKHGDIVGRVASNAFLVLLFALILLKVASALDRKSSSGRTA